MVGSGSSSSGAASSSGAVSSARTPIGPDTIRVVSVVILGSIMSVLDTTIVNVALESLSRDLHARLNDVQWVVTGYLLSLAAVIPVAGWAARRFGAKRLYIAALIMFTAGSALCGLATTTKELIVFRVIQGLGGGMIFPVGQMIVVKAAGPERLARVMGAMGVPMVLGPVLGPTLGGLLIDHVGWRWIFYINVPIGVVAVLTALRRLPAQESEDAGPFDFMGLGLVASGLVAITFGLAEIGQAGGHETTHVLLPLIAGAALVAAFVVRATRVPRPLLDLRLYANKTFTAASVTVFSLGAAFFGGMILMPLYLQTVRHEDAVYTGLLLAPRGIGASTATWISGRLTDRIGSGATAALGGVITVAFGIPFVMLGAHTSMTLIIVVLVCQGFGLGLSFMPAMTAAFRVLRPEQVDDAAPQLSIVMRVGGSIGTAILTVVLQHRLSAAGGSVVAQAGAFAGTYWWVTGTTAVALLPTVVLVLAERRLAMAGSAGAGPPDETVAGRLAEIG